MIIINYLSHWLFISTIINHSLLSLMILMCCYCLIGYWQLIVMMMIIDLLLLSMYLILCVVCSSYQSIQLSIIDEFNQTITIDLIIILPSSLQPHSEGTYQRDDDDYQLYYFIYYFCYLLIFFFWSCFYFLIFI